MGWNNVWEYRWGKPKDSNIADLFLVWRCRPHCWTFQHDQKKETILKTVQTTVLLYPFGSVHNLPRKKNILKTKKHKTKLTKNKRKLISIGMAKGSWLDGAMYFWFIWFKKKKKIACVFLTLFSFSFSFSSWTENFSLLSAKWIFLYES